MGKKFNIVDVERENRSFSMLILSSPNIYDWKQIYIRLLVNLVNDSGIWKSKSLKSIENLGVTIMKAKHSFKSIHHREEILLRKLL